MSRKRSNKSAEAERDTWWKSGLSPAYREMVETGRFTRKETEQAADIANDVAEDIDNGESRAVLRRTVHFYALLAHYERQEAAALDSRLKIMTLGLELMNSAVKKKKGNHAGIRSRSDTDGQRDQDVPRDGGQRGGGQVPGGRCGGKHALQQSRLPVV